MTQPETQLTTPQEVASRLHNQLDEDLRDWLEDLATPQDKLLIADTCGLLIGIASGRVTTGQERILANLKEVLPSVIERCEDGLQRRRISEAFQRYVTSVAGHGLSVDGYPLAPVRKQGRAID